MKKTISVFLQEIIITFRRPSYIIMAFVVPVLGVAIMLGVKAYRSRAPVSDDTASESVADTEMDIEGFVDYSGIISILPPDTPADFLIAYESEALANKALENEEIGAYYVIPPDYLEKGDVFYVYPDSKSYLSDGQDWTIKWILNMNLLDGDKELADRIWNPVWNLEEITLTEQATEIVDTSEDCSRPGVACESNEFIRYIPAIMVVLFYLVIMMSSSMLLNSIATEKENRTIEILMSSISPQQMLSGKTIALGTAGLLQMIVWLICVYILLLSGGSTLNLPVGFTIPFNIAFWGLVLFIGGFGVYGSLMAGVGVLVPKIKEAGAASFIAMAPLLFGYIVGLLSPIADKAEAILPVFLSFFPLTSPVVMIMRLTNGTVGFWQPLLASGLLYITAYFTQKAAARMFHAQNLLSGQPFSVKRFTRGFIGID